MGKLLFDVDESPRAELLPVYTTISMSVQERQSFALKVGGKR